MCLVQDSISKGRMVKPVNWMQTGAFKFNVDFLYWKEGVMGGSHRKGTSLKRQKLVIIRRKSTLYFYTSYTLLPKQPFCISCCSRRAIILEIKKNVTACCVHFCLYTHLKTCQGLCQL